MSLATIFVICAAAGGTLFVVQLVLQFMGFMGHGDLDTDVDGAAGHASADFSFKVLSLQGFTAFFMMFGLVGLAAMKSFAGGSTPISVTAGIAGGLATTWLIGRLFRMASGLQSSGNIDISRALGATGTVYLTVRKERMGKVTITVTGRLLTLDARGLEDSVLETGTPIVVTRVIDDATVEVKRS
jgi:membrane protein implicated in regulation of membrane protease activity